MTSRTNLVCLYASLQDKRDELKRALALFDSGLSHLDGSLFTELPNDELHQRGLYLLDLYQREVMSIIESLGEDIGYLGRVKDALK